MRFVVPSLFYSPKLQTMAQLAQLRITLCKRVRYYRSIYFYHFGGVAAYHHTICVKIIGKRQFFSNIEENGR